MTLMLSTRESPLFVMQQPSSLVSAKITPDAVSGALLPTDLSVKLYRRNSGGAGQTLLAYIDRNAAHATGWSAFRPKELLIAHGNMVVQPGETVTMIAESAAAIPDFQGCLTMTWRRVD